jgi:hypothetical protein
MPVSFPTAINYSMPVSYPCLNPSNFVSKNQFINPINNPNFKTGFSYSNPSSINQNQCIVIAGQNFNNENPFLAVGCQMEELID